MQYQEITREEFVKGKYSLLTRVVPEWNNLPTSVSTHMMIHYKLAEPVLVLEVICYYVAPHFSQATKAAIEKGSAYVSVYFYKVSCPEHAKLWKDAGDTGRNLQEFQQRIMPIVKEAMDYVLTAREI